MHHSTERNVSNRSYEGGGETRGGTQSGRLLITTSIKVRNEQHAEEVEDCVKLCQLVASTDKEGVKIVDAFAARLQSYASRDSAFA